MKYLAALLFVTSIVVDGGRVYVGTPQGLYEATTDRKIEGVEGAVRAMAWERGRGVVATNRGIFLLDDGAVKISDLAATTVALSDTRIFAGGDFGVVELGGRTISTVSAQSILVDGSELIIADDNGLHLWRFDSDTPRVLLDGIGYSRIVVSDGNRWFGLRADGGIDVGHLLRPNYLTPLELAIAADPATAIAPRRGGVYIGTMRGRLLEADHRSAKVIRDPKKPAHPIHAIAVFGDTTYLGTEGGGLIALGADMDAEPAIAPDTAAPPPVLAAEPARPSRWITVVEQHRSKLLLALGALVVIFLGVLTARRLARGRQSAVRERRRASRAEPDLPPIERLSPDIAQDARRLRTLTDTVNALSRDAALSETGEIEERTVRARTEFGEIDERMRKRLAGIRADRSKKMADVAAIRTAVQQGTATEDDKRRLGEIEEWVALADRDERYLKYVLEE